MATFVHVKRFIPLSLIFPLLLLSVCLFNDSNPLDPNGDNYITPSFTINTDNDNIGDGDTIHKTSAKLVVAGNQNACVFQVKVDNRDTVEWQSDGTFLLQSLSDGSHDVLIKCKYNGGTDIVPKTIHFVALTDGYVPKFINVRDSQVYTDTAKTVILNAAVTGPGPFTYQWYKDTVMLEGKTDSLLVIDSVTKVHTGVYYCIVTNKYDAIKGPLLTVSIVGKEKVFSILYHDNGSTSGSVPSDGALYGKGDVATVRTNTWSLLKNGFEFAGWCMDSLCSGIPISGGNELIIGTENVHLYAKWNPRPTFTVTYNGNGNTGGKVPFDPMAHTPGENVTVKKNPPDLVKDGYYFSGWNTQNDGLGNPYAAGEEIVNISKDIILYARWTMDQKYFVVYKGNGNTSGAQPVDSNQYDPNVTIIVKNNINGLERTGYSFVGWNTSPNGSGKNYASGDKLTITGNVILYAKWTQSNVYSITYNGNDNISGSVPVDSNQYEPGQKIIVKTNTGKLARDGFTFTGWNTRADGYGVQYAADAEITVADSNIVLYAKWTQGETYTVVYNGNGNTAGNIPVDINNYALHSTAIIKANDNNLLKTGYRFTGWCFDKDGNGQRYAPQDTIAILGNTALYAVWTQVFSFSVIYDGNGNTSGTVPVDTNLYEVGSLVIARDNQNNLAKDGYTFGGWNTMPDGSGEKLHEDSKFSMVSSNVTLYAYWTQKETFTVTYDINGGTDGSAPVDNNKYESGTSVTIMDNYRNLVKAGYTFAGWNTKADGSGTPYASGNTFIISDNTTLYAKWSTQRTYTVSYQGNGNTSGIVPVDNNAYEQGYTAVALGNNGNLQKDGYSFTGWNVMADGTGTSYSPNAEVKIDTQNVVLYAVWTRNTVRTYKLTYNNNQATTGSVPVDNSLYKENSIAVIIGNTGSLVRTGYSFAGWGRSATCQTADIYMPGDTINMSGDIVLYACWTTEKMYMVVYSGNGSTSGAVPKDENLYLPGVNVTVKGNTGSLVKSGYTFVGWNTKADGSGVTYASNSRFVKGNGDDTLYAKWSAKPTFIVTYNSNFATWGTVPSDANSYEEGAPVTLKTNSGNLVRYGYSFKGWNTKSDGTGTAYPVGASMTMPAANTELYADWNLIITYTVTYNGNGSTGGSVPFDPTAYISGANVVVKGNTGNLVRNSYNFNGWNTKPEGNGVAYSGGWSFQMGNANVTLYAVWTQNPTYKVYYNANWASSGNTPSDNNNYRQGDTVTILGNIGGLTRNGYTFAGWSTSSSGTGQVYVLGNKFTMGTDVINLYAVWKPVTYYVVFDDQDATTPVSPDSMAVAFPDTCVKTLPAAPSKSGYLFGGWYTSSNGTGSIFTATTRVPGRMIVFANWLPCVSVLYNGNGNTSGSAPSDTAKYLSGTTAKVMANTSLVKTGYTFANWNSANNGSGKFYAADDIIQIGRNAITLYATWRVTILFDDQGATTAPDSATVSRYFPDTLLTTFPSNPSRIGYTFTGWYTAANGGTEFTKATKITANDTVFARWSINSYTIKYDGNGNTDGNAPSVITLPYNQSTTTATAGTLVRTGYKFTGWNTAPSGKGIAYAASAPIVVISDVTMYAQWTPLESFTITFDKNSADASGSMLKQAVESGTSAALTLNSYTNKGYKFAGWSKSADGEVAYADGADYTMEISDDTLYAIWLQNASHTVTFNRNSSTATGEMSKQSIVEGVSAVLSMNKFTNTGYSFSGWSTTEDGAVAYQNGADYTMGSSDVILYAVWKQNALHTVTFNQNSSTATGEMSKQSIVEGVSAALTMNAFTNTGYSFSGWSTTEDGAVAYQNGASYTMETSDVILYAVWKQNASHTVTFNQNSSAATGEMLKQSFVEGVSAALTMNAFTNTGYSFSGWSTTENGAVAYQNGANYTVGTSDDTLYAVWTRNTHLVKFIAEDATGTMANQSIAEGESAALSLNAFTIPGYKFRGWATTSGGTVEYEDGAMFTMGTSNVTLFAVWIPNPSHGVTFNKNHASADGEMTQQFIREGQTVALTLNAFSLKNYKFLGWATSGTGSVVYKDGENYTMDKSDVELFAIWESTK